MTIRTATQLYDELDRELGWRKKELITFKLMIDDGRPHQAEVLRRAGVALLYAHWEGFVKNAGTYYLQFVSGRRMTHRQLKPNFLALAIKAKLHAAAETTKASIFNEVAGFFVDKLDERARLLWEGAVQTKSNLSAQRLREIMLTLGLDYAPFETKEKTVVERLREARNNIAHGRHLSIDAAAYDRLHHEVLWMVDEYRGQIDTATHLQTYRRPPLDIARSSAPSG